MNPQPTVDEAAEILSALAESFLATSAAWQAPAEKQSNSRPAQNAGPDYEARYKALIDHIPGIIFIAPLQVGSGEAYVSPQIQAILGFTPEEWLGDPLRWYQQVHPEDKQRWSIEAASLFLSGKPLSSTYRVLSRSGRVVWFQCDARMVHSHTGQPSFIHGVGFDITDLKEAEESLKRAHQQLEFRVEKRTQELALTNARLKDEIAQHERTESELVKAIQVAESAMRIKGEFLANMSHEIRTPMNGVLGLTALVLKTELTADQHEYLSMAYSSAQSLLQIINQVLDFSKVESGKVELRIERFALRRNIGDLIGEMSLQATQKGLNLEYRISPDLPTCFLGDAGRLRQVLTNVIGNAIKFTHTGRVLLEIDPAESVPPIQHRSCAVRFAVTDTGIGIHEAKLETILKPFEQADGSITRDYGGTGLGLAISKEIVEMMGGRLKVTSEVGRGTTFSFTIQLPIAPEEASVPEIDQTEQETTASLRILVAEDNPVNQRVAQGVLERYGHSVTLSTNGQQALETYCANEFDVILMDIQMPVMDGLSASKAIRASEALRGASHIPIIGLTAHALDADRTRCLDAGMDGYLSKPFVGEELMALIESLRRRH